MKLKLPVKSLRAQTALVFGLLMVALAVSLSLGLAAMLTRQIQRDEGQALQVAARNATRVLAEVLDTRSREVQVMAAAPELWRDGVESPIVRAALARSQAANPGNTWIGVTDSEGVIRAATAGLMVGRSAKERPWFAPGTKGLHVGDVHLAKMLAAVLPPLPSGEPLRFVDFAAPVKRDGELLGVLVTHGSFAWADEVIQTLAPANAQARQLESFIFDREGVMIYAPAGTLAKHLAAQQTLVQLGGSGRPAGAPPAVVLTWADGQEYLTTVVPVKPVNPVSDLGWVVVSREPVSIAFAEAHESAVTALAIGLVAALLSSVMVWFLAGRIAKPLTHIARAARDVERGLPGASIPVMDSSTEVTRLSAALAGMTRRLLDLNKDLEDRVKARTAELERANAELASLAHIDPLTTLLNRRGFDEQARAALASARRRKAPLSLITIDADHFKRVNDNFGHEIGDITLKAIADVMRTRLRECDVLGRLGGEEFIALLPDTPAEGAFAVANDLLALVAATPLPQVGRITISCGVTALGLDKDDLMAALRRADQALYRAKAGGRNRACNADAVDAPEAAEAV